MRIRHHELLFLYPLGHSWYWIGLFIYQNPTMVCILDQSPIPQIKQKDHNWWCNNSMAYHRNFAIDILESVFAIDAHFIFHFHARQDCDSLPSAKAICMTYLLTSH
jgi:hypothetical protein